MSLSEGVQHWHEVAVRSPAGGDGELLADLLRTLAPAGVVVASGGACSAYFPSADDAALVAVALRAAGGVVQVSEVPPAWTEWRQAFAPVRAGERVQVCPPWAAPDRAVLAAMGPGSPAITVVIDPGLAFGTGDHPTTATCLSHLERLVRAGSLVVDVGTGSGVLAIAAALLGAGRVVAVDIDPVACRAAEANLGLNPAVPPGAVEIVCGDALQVLTNGGAATAPGADLVLANLTSDLLGALMPSLAGLLAPAGRLVVSGISYERRAEIYTACGAAGLCVRRRDIQGGWLTLVLAVRPGLPA